jgi:Domain of unknown function (DUF3291)
MKPNRWKIIQVVEDNGEYLALLSYLPLKSYLKIPAFLKHTLAIERQLKASAGLIGYSLQAEVLGKRFWTLSVWNDEQSLMDFVFKIPHKDVMKSLAGDMEQTKFTRWKLTGSFLPPDWNEARKRMAKE